MAEPGESGRAHSGRHHGAHRHRQRHAAPTRRPSSDIARGSCARGSKAACSWRTTCASTTASSGASSRALGSEWRAPNLCTVRLSRALYPGDAASQSRCGDGTSRHPASRTAIAPCRMRRCCWSSGASCARHGRAKLCSMRWSSRPARHPAGSVVAGSRRRFAGGAPGCTGFSARARTAPRLFYMWARPTTCASGCWIIFASAPAMRSR